MELREFTRFLGTLFYGASEEVVSLWKELDDDVLEEFLKACKRDGTMPFVYRKLYDAGLREGLQKLEAQNVRQNAFAIGNQMKFGAFCALLDGHGIRYAPIKGIDLAFRIYPSPALRSFCDWDVLIHCEDFFKAVRILLDNGWATDGEPLSNSFPEHFHYSIMRKDGICLEPHWMLPGFDGATPAQIWQFIHPAKEGACRHILEPSLNMLLLTRHASRGFYTVMPLSRMLLDAAYIIQSEGFDWQKCRELSDALNLPCSADLLAAFQEFFPKSVIDEMHADPERADAYWKVFEQREFMVLGFNMANLVYSNANHFSLAWIWSKVKAKCSGKLMRKVHHLPPKGHNLRILGYMLKTLFENALHCLKFQFKRNPAVIDYSALIKKAEGTSK